MADTFIKIDTTQLQAQVLASLPSKADGQAAVRRIATGAMRYWRDIAQAELKSTAQDYLNGLSMDEANGVMSLTLQDGERKGGGPLPNMVERGWSGGDMRDWLLKSPKVKQGKNGPYLVVPFRHGSPGTTERNVGKVMPKSIYAEAQKLSPTLSKPSRGGVNTTGGVTKVHGTRLYPNKKMSENAQAILGRKEKPWHSTSIYMGMIRKAQTTKSGKSTSGYTTFRVISRYSSGDKHWVHPGIKAKHFAKRVQAYIEKIVAAETMTGAKGS